VAAGALGALAPRGAALLVVSARPAELLAAMRDALSSSAAAHTALNDGSLAGARVVPLNAGGAGVLILSRA
jgi:hypothetical protein